MSVSFHEPEDGPMVVPEHHRTITVHPPEATKRPVGFGGFDRCVDCAWDICDQGHVCIRRNNRFILERVVVEGNESATFQECVICGAGQWALGVIDHEPGCLEIRALAQERFG